MTFYAINKQTKEHQAFDDACAAIKFAGAHPDKWSIVHADADGWIPWSGGECPLPDGTKVEVKRRDSDDFLIDFAGRSFAFMDDDFWHHDNNSYDITAYRPILSDDEGEQPEGNGEWLPPVGTFCGLRYMDQPWIEAEIRGYFGGKVWFASALTGDKVEMADNCSFRPIRSDEERAVDEMLALDEYDPSNDLGMMSRKDFCRALYRAGYRKQ